MEVYIIASWGIKFGADGGDSVVGHSTQVDSFTEVPPCRLQDFTT